MALVQIITNITNQNFSKGIIESEVEVEPTVHQSAGLGLLGVQAAVRGVLVEQVGSDGAAGTEGGRSRAQLRNRESQLT